MDLHSVNRFLYQFVVYSSFNFGILPVHSGIILLLFSVTSEFYGTVSPNWGGSDDAFLFSVSLLLRLPSKTSINESEFKYDFIPKTAEPKVPHLTKEAVKHAIAQNKAKQVENNCLPKKAIHTSSLNPILRTFSTEVNPSVPNSTFRRQNKQIDTSIEKYIRSSFNPVIKDGGQTTSLPLANWMTSLKSKRYCRKHPRYHGLSKTVQPAAK
ncbi:predicted protein [Scheffersomyces stipitis CBS 6054]|uniref:Uncharacterized protein n=1 Tax=Scheffersomyces stipitis (strain ATCC 58785 / CBS 6054 / NBRC 10063 / NRRL Y-11545) TaxID=322104 RepID=A3LVW3_PICST|nr:predicted protein [Scheffersomyces stipitis CBS 6054]ABN67186.2 predicted protein [Scheffersomyces stipitis CBS 6054]